MKGRQGFALIITVMLLLALSVLAVAAVTTGIVEQKIAATATGTARARALAEAAARRAFAEWSSRTVRGLPRGSVHVAVSAESVRFSVERIDPLMFLVRSEARVGLPQLATARAGLLVRVVDLAGVEASFPAAVWLDGHARLTSGTVSGADPCVAETSLGPALVSESLDAGPAAVIDGEAALVPAGSGPPPPEVFAPPLVTAIATVEWRAARARPTPIGSADGRCVPAPDNWGAVDPGGPCYSRLPVIYAAGDLTVDGGELRGILVVGGDLTVTGDAVLRGIVVVAGTLRLSEAGAISGAVRAGGLDMTGGSARLDRCQIEAVLASRALDRGYRPGQRWWVPIH